MYTWFDGIQDIFSWNEVYKMKVLDKQELFQTDSV